MRCHDNATPDPHIAQHGGVEERLRRHHRHRQPTGEGSTGRTRRLGSAGGTVHGAQQYTVCAREGAVVWVGASSARGEVCRLCDLPAGKSSGAPRRPGSNACGVARTLETACPPWGPAGGPSLRHRRPWPASAQRLLVGQGSNHALLMLVLVLVCRS